MENTPSGRLASASASPGGTLGVTGAISSTQSRNTPAGPQPGSTPSVGGSRGLAQTQAGTARSLSGAQFSGVSPGMDGD